VICVSENWERKVIKVIEAANKKIKGKTLMITGALKSQVDRVWDAFWSGGIANPLIGELTGAKQYGWSIVVTVPESPTITIFSGSNPTMTHRFLDFDFPKDAPLFEQENEELFNFIFNQGHYSALALNWEEETQFRRYFRGFNGDPSSISGQLPRMFYLSAVVITTLGLSDIIPITSKARMLVAAEAVIGIVFAGLFLNALAYRASIRPGRHNSKIK